MRLVRLTNRDPDFYDTLGPMLSRRAIVRETGHPTWDDDGKRWVVAVGEVPRGCGALSPAGRIESLYVYPAHRGRGVARAIVGDLLDWRGAGSTTAVATDASVGVFSAHGFVEAGRRGRFTVMMLGR